MAMLFLVFLKQKIALLIHILLGDNKINEIMKKLKNKQVSIAHSFAGNELRKAG
jgi:hypothetical protein